MPNYHLQRTWYRTDVSDDEPEYAGAFSSPIPDLMLNGAQIVAVNWVNHGEVEVTFLVSGDGPLGRTTSVSPQPEGEAP